MELIHCVDGHQYSFQKEFGFEIHFYRSFVLLSLYTGLSTVHPFIGVFLWKRFHLIYSEIDFFIFIRFFIRMSTLKCVAWIKANFFNWIQAIGIPINANASCIIRMNWLKQWTHFFIFCTFTSTLFCLFVSDCFISSVFHTLKTEMLIRFKVQSTKNCPISFLGSLCAHLSQPKQLHFVLSDFTKWIPKYQTGNCLNSFWRWQ